MGGEPTKAGPGVDISGSFVVEARTRCGAFQAVALFCSKLGFRCGACLEEPLFAVSKSLSFS